MQTSRRRHLRYANEQSTHNFWLCRTHTHQFAKIPTHTPNYTFTYTITRYSHIKLRMFDWLLKFSFSHSFLTPDQCSSLNNVVQVTRTGSEINGDASNMFRKANSQKHIHFFYVHFYIENFSCNSLIFKRSNKCVAWDNIQLLPALKVNIIIVHPRALAQGKTTSQR